jgi:hypothetical protein
MIIIKRFFNPEAPGQEGASTTDSADNIMDEFSNDVSFDSLADSALTDKVEVEDETKAKDEEGLDNEEFDLPTDKEEEEKLEEKKEEEADEEEDPFGLDEEEGKETEEAEEDKTLLDEVIEDAENNWLKVAEEIGIEVEEDSIEALKVGFEKELQEAYEEGIALGEEKLAKLPEEAREILEYVANGGTIETFIEPFKQIDSLLAMENIDLVEFDLQNTPGWTEEMVATELNKMVENDEIDHNASKLRAILNNQKEITKKELLTEQAEKAALKERTESQKRETEINDIKNVLGETKEFLDVPIKDKHREYLLNEFKKGNFEKVTNNPKEQVEFMLWKAFGKPGIQKLKQNSFEEGQAKLREVLHKVPTTQKETPGRRSNTIAQNEESDFAQISFD